MARDGLDQVAVYIDFDNIVISRYDELHGRGAFRADNAGAPEPSQSVAERLATAHVDLAAILDYAASFGTVAITRAYADWSAPANSRYRSDTAESSIDLVQMFPLSGTKNGADIRLAIDVIDDLSRYDFISHVLIVAGDSDYVSLAQRCKRLGRTVIGVGAAGSVGRYWNAACDVFRLYGKLPGVTTPPSTKPPTAKPTKSAKATAATKVTKATKAAKAAAEPPPVALLRRALSLQGEKSPDGWVGASTLKNQMLRLDATFNEKDAGYKTFSAFLAANSKLVETRSNDMVLSVRLKEAAG
jgi:hypothetical protein